MVKTLLRAKGLLETPRHSVCSRPHSFEDCMLAAEVDDRVRGDLFGRWLDRERYGKGVAGTCRRARRQHRLMSQQRPRPLLRL